MTEGSRAIATVGRYALFDEIASGGMASVHLGRLLGPIGFSRTVAIKRLHAQFAKDPDFVSSFLDEARLAARIQHPNVVATLDVVAAEGEVFLVMEYVQGETMSKLMKASRQQAEFLDLQVVSAIVTSALYGLHAAHEAKSEQGTPLGVVHRDVSPQNIMVCSDGVARVLDFGIAKAQQRINTTAQGTLKGKLAYMSPEQLNGDDVDRRTDVFACGIVLWEALALRRLFDAKQEGEVIRLVREAEIPRPSEFRPEIPEELDQVVMKALERDIDQRFQTAREFAVALEAAMPPATARQLGEWVEGLRGDSLKQRAARLAELESITASNSEKLQSDPMSSEEALELVQRDSLSQISVPNLSVASAAPSTAPPGEGTLSRSEPPAAPGAGSSLSALHDVSSLRSPSEPSSPTASVALTSEHTQTKPKRNKALLVLPAVLLLGVVGFIAVKLSGDDEAPTSPARAAVAATANPPATTTEAAPAPTASSKAEVEAEAEAKAEAEVIDADEVGEAVAQPVAKGPSSQPANIQRPKPPTKPASEPKPAPKAAPAANCNPPFTINERGIRVPKPQCL